MEGWKEAMTPAGKVYYYNTITKQTQWNKPAELSSQYASRISHLHEHPLVYMIAYSVGFICNLCANQFSTNTKSWNCPVCKFDLCAKCMDANYRSYLRVNEVDVLTAATNFPTFLPDEGVLGVTSGKWYYEVKILTVGIAQIGWTNKNGFKANESVGLGVGDDLYSFSYDGSRKVKFYNAQQTVYGKQFRSGDIVGALLDLDFKYLSFSLNGENFGIAFSIIECGLKGIVPGITLKNGTKIEYNFGAGAFSFKPYEYKAFFNKPPTKIDNDPNLLAQKLGTSLTLRENTQYTETISNLEKQLSKVTNELEQEKLKTSKSTTVKINQKLTKQSLSKLSLPELDNITKILQSNIETIEAVKAERVSEQNKDKSTCCICFAKEKNTLFVPCGHLCSCDECAKNLSKCPVCRTDIQQKHKAFIS